MESVRPPGRHRRFWVECAAMVVIGIPFIAGMSLLTEGPLHMARSGWLEVAIGGAGLGLAKRVAALYVESRSAATLAASQSGRARNDRSGNPARTREIDAKRERD